MSGQEQGFRECRRAEGDDDVAGLEARRPRHDRVCTIEAPVRGLALGFPKGAMLLPPAWKRRQTQPLRDDAVHVLEQEDFGQQILVLRAGLQLAHGLVADFEQFRSRDRVLVFLEPLQEELLILLLQRAWRPARGRNAPPGAGLVRALEGKRGQHGSTCTVTSWSARSFFSRSSTASAMACASATFAAGSTAIVTSA